MFAVRAAPAVVNLDQTQPGRARLPLAAVLVDHGSWNSRSAQSTCSPPPVWVGGTVALVAVAVPYARSLGGEERAAALYQLGRRWRPLGWGALAVLVVTGLLSAYEHDALGREALLRTDAGEVMILKGALVAALVVFAALHDFVLAPRLARQIRAGHPQTARPLLVRVGWASFALTLAIPVLGVVLASELSHG